MWLVVADIMYDWILQEEDMAYQMVLVVTLGGDGVGDGCCSWR